MKIVLVPVARLDPANPVWRTGDVLDVISRAGTEQSKHPFRPQSGGDAGGAAAPVLSTKKCVFDVEAVHQRQQIRPAPPAPRNAALVPIETGRTIATQKRHDANGIPMKRGSSLPGQRHGRHRESHEAGSSERHPPGLTRNRQRLGLPRRHVSKFVLATWSPCEVGPIRRRPCRR
jgi:hypothetical protein